MARQCENLIHATSTDHHSHYARRKRFKRFFDKDEEPLQLTGSTLGTPGNDAPPILKTPRTPRTPKTKSSAAATGVDAYCSPNAKKTGGKRKAETLSKENSEDGAGSNVTSKDDTSPAEEESTTTDKSPKKKSKSIKAAASKAPKSPEVTVTPKTPNASKMPKSSRKTTSNKLTKVVKTEESEEATGLEDNVAKEKQGGRVGSPELQARTDGYTMRMEKESGGTVEEPEGQAIHEGSEKADASTDE